MQLLGSHVAAVQDDACSVETAPHPLLRSNVVSFKMFWNARHCLLKFLLEYTRVVGKVSPKRQLAMTIGNLLENVLEAIQRKQSKDQCLEIIEHAVLGLRDWERSHVLGRLKSLLHRAQELESAEPPRQTLREVAKQYYGVLPNGWRIPAKPDRVDYPIADNERSLPIEIRDTKSSGSLQEKTIAQLNFFGLAISLDERSKREKTGQDDQSARPISLQPVLLGKQRDVTGALVDAPQVPAWEYDVSTELGSIAEIMAVTDTIQQAFARNEFPATVSSECEVCDYKHLCPAMRLLEKQARSGKHERNRSRRSRQRAPQFGRH